MKIANAIINHFKGGMGEGGSIVMNTRIMMFIATRRTSCRPLDAILIEERE